MSEKKRMGLYLGIVFVLAWGAYIVAWVCGLHYGDTGFRTVLTIAAFFPALAMIICRKVGDEGYDLDDAYIAPHLRGNVRRYLFAYFFPLFLVCLTCLLFFAFFPENCDLAATEFLDGMVETGMERERAVGAMYSQIMMTIVAGPLINVLTTFAEELGFRGYLLPKLKHCFQKYAGLKSALVCGALWSAWYLPLYGDGYLYGTGYPGYPVLGFVTGFLFYGLLGVILSYFAFKTGSVIPGALLRSGISAMAVTGVYFTTGESYLVVGPSVYGLCGCLALLLFALLYGLRMLRMERQGVLYYAPPPPRKKRKRTKVAKK